MVDLKMLHTRIDAQGRVGFAVPDRMEQLLHITPGTVTPLAVLNDIGNLVTVVLDKQLLVSAQVNFHPMNHTESIGLTPAELQRFLGSCAHPPLFVSVD